MFEKGLWKSDILSKDTGLGFYISETLVENGLMVDLWLKLQMEIVD